MTSAGVASASAFVTNGGISACGEPRVERDPVLARERVGADGDEPQLRVPEHPVERLLAGVAGRADDRDVCHRCIVCVALLLYAGAGRLSGLPVAVPPAIRHPWMQMLCLAVSVPDSDERHRCLRAA